MEQSQAKVCAATSPPCVACVDAGDLQGISGESKVAVSRVTNQAGLFYDPWLGIVDD